MRKTLFVIALMIAVVIGLKVDAFCAGTGTHVGTYVTYGNVTMKFTIDGDSATSCGVSRKSDSAVYTPWVSVPVGIPFFIYTETRDADSSKAFGPDTVHLGLFTAPERGLAVDSLGIIKKENKSQTLWDFRSLLWSEWTQQTYFYQGPADTTSAGLANGKRGPHTFTIDTQLVAAASLKSGVAQGGGASMTQNLGKLQFRLWMDATDSILDGGVRLNCYIIFRDPSDGKYQYPKQVYGSADFDHESYGLIEKNPMREPEIPEWALATVEQIRKAKN